MKRIVLLLAGLALTTSLCNAQHPSVRYSGDVGLYGCGVSGDYGKGSCISVETVHGVDIGKMTFVGIGSGINYSVSSDEFFVPAFIEGRVNLSRGKGLTPYISTKIGGLFCTSRSSNIATLNPSIGVKYSRLSISLGYMYMYFVDKDRMTIAGTNQAVRTTGADSGFNIGLSYTLF
jgi:hypothetical protein